MASCLLRFRRYSLNLTHISLLMAMLKRPIIFRQRLHINTENHCCCCEALCSYTGDMFQSAVLTHMMSVFTFMGAGLLKKDNDLTLEIIEQTLSTMFAAVMDEEVVN